MNQEKRTALQKSQKKWPIIIMAALLALMLMAASLQTNKVREILNDSAYTNTENSLRNLSDMVSNTFALDQRYLEVLSSAIADAEDRQKWLDTLDYDTQNIQGIFYGDRNADTAAGKNEAVLNLADHTFTEHANGQVRSEAFMTEYGTYSYLMREPVRNGDETEGYLYIQYPMRRLRWILPQDVSNGNDVSLMEASTMTYVYVPATSASGVHVNYNNLQYYLKDPSLAPGIVKQIEDAISQKQYYMRILTFAHSENGTVNGQEYVVFLWPVDDGEYYISGFSRVDYLQGERVSVEKTIQAMIVMLLGIGAVVLFLVILLFANMAASDRKRAVLQKKHNDELNDALQIAKIANESKSNFLSNMSHDIRTPMNAIVGYTTLISREAEHPQKVREYVKKITGAGDYLLGLINDVLDMSKIESGKTTLNITAFSIRKLVGEVESIIRMQAENNQQNFCVYIENVEHDFVMGDELRIRQIILNLLSNALKYTPAGGKIDFTLQGVPQKKEKLQKLRIVVQDTGYGMDPAYIQTIFEPFTRLNNSMTGKIQGTGLGLAITKNIVDLMGGTITVSSVLNEGSTFTVELELPVASGNVAPDGDPAEEATSFALDGLHILAAEDNELNAEILTELLSMEHASCRICRDGEEVVDEFERAEPGTYDLILMDIQMPKRNGYEAARMIRTSAHSEAKTIPIVAMTANAFAEDVLEALQAGMNAHVAKPVDMNALKKTLGKVLNKGKNQAENDTANKIRSDVGQGSPAEERKTGKDETQKNEG